MVIFFSRVCLTPEHIEKIGQLISGISEGATRIGKIVEALGGFARQDAGDLDQPVDPNAVVESAMVIVNNLIKNSTHHPSVELEDEPCPKFGGINSSLNRLSSI